MKKICFISTILYVFLTSPSLQAKLIELIKINSHIVLDIRYATTNNFTGKQVYPSALCFLEKDAALALDKVQKELETKGLGLKIFDGYRPLTFQKLFWEICPDERYVANPEKGSKHNRGIAVDLTLIDLKTGKELEMPSGFDDFSQKAHRIYEKMTPLAAHNCKMLENIMRKHGWTGWKEEWWHYNFDDGKVHPVLDLAFANIDFVH